MVKDVTGVTVALFMGELENPIEPLLIAMVDVHGIDIVELNFCTVRGLPGKENPEISK
jgi:hypothetical protein